MTERLKILVVDDEVVLAKALQRRLAAHDVVIEFDGASAVASVGAAALEGSPFDVVLCDVQMPDQNGIEVLTRLRSMPDVPILVLMSGDDDLGEKAAVADGTLLKPFRTDEILDLVAGVKARKAVCTTQRIRRCAGL